MMVDGLLHLLAGQRCDGLIENLAQHGLVSAHSHAQLIFIVRYFTRNFQVDKSLFSDGIGRHGQGAHRQFRLAGGDKLQRLPLGGNKDNF
ncbi:hypothetical protein SDC9_104600 [bioreactor metagenome]|uniref:Uncharacterized protein n=1 Tax=bioreactor metagenome TaxID=1076179 RepID=A0A645AXA1_9ZZZZ